MREESDIADFQELRTFTKDLLDKKRRFYEEEYVKRSVFFNLPFPFWVKNLNGKYLIANASLLQYAKCKQLEDTGFYDCDIWGLDYLSIVKDTDKKVLIKKDVLVYEKKMNGKPYFIIKYPYFKLDDNTIETIGGVAIPIKLLG